MLHYLSSPQLLLFLTWEVAEGWFTMQATAATGLLGPTPAHTVLNSGIMCLAVLENWALEAN